MSRTLAKWPVEIEGYTPSARNDVQIQAAWNEDKTKLVVYLLNRTDENTTVTLDLSGLAIPSQKASIHLMTAAEGTTQETVKSQGNIIQSHRYCALDTALPQTFSMPRFSFTEIVIGL